MVLSGAIGTSLVETQSSRMPVSPATITSQGGRSSRQDMKRFLLSHRRKQRSSKLTAAALTTFKKSRKAWLGPGSEFSPAPSHRDHKDVWARMRQAALLSLPSLLQIITVK